MSRINFVLLSIATFSSLACTAETEAFSYRAVGAPQILVEDHGGMPALCRADNGDLLLAYATHWQPIPPAGGSVKLMRSSDGGATWTQPQTVVQPKDPENWSVHMWSGLHQMPDHALIMTYGQNRSEEVAEAYVIRSTDNGETWGSPVRVAGEPVYWDGVTVAAPFTEGFGHPVTLHNGDVLAPIGARREGGFYGTKASAFVRSTDSGATWGPLEFIATGDSKFSETSMGVAANGNIVAVVRCDTTNRILWRSVSYDGGLTWSTPQHTVALEHVENYIKGKMPDMLALPSGRLVLAVGSVGLDDGGQVYDGEPGASYSGLFVSDDSGATWRQDLLFPSADPDNLIPYDSPLLVQAPDGDILAISVQYDRRTKDNPLRGWTMGSHLVLHTIREVPDPSVDTQWTLTDSMSTHLNDAEVTARDCAHSGNNAAALVAESTRLVGGDPGQWWFSPVRGLGFDANRGGLRDRAKWNMSTSGMGPGPYRLDLGGAHCPRGDGRGIDAYLVGGGGDELIAELDGSGTLTVLFTVTADDIDGGGNIRFHLATSPGNYQNGTIGDMGDNRPGAAVLYAVPEPMTISLLLLAGGLAALFRRRPGAKES